MESVHNLHQWLVAVACLSMITVTSRAHYHENRLPEVWSPEPPEAYSCPDSRIWTPWRSQWVGLPPNRCPRWKKIFFCKKMEGGGNEKLVGLENEYLTFSFRGSKLPIYLLIMSTILPRSWWPHNLRTSTRGTNRKKREIWLHLSAISSVEIYVDKQLVEIQCQQNHMVDVLVPVTVDSDGKHRSCFTKPRKKKEVFECLSVIRHFSSLAPMFLHCFVHFFLKKVNGTCTCGPELLGFKKCKWG